MKTSIIISTKDPAGLNIRENLLELGFKESGEEFDGHKVCILEDFEQGEARLYTTDTDSIHCEHMDKTISKTGFVPELVVFATRHRSASGIKSLSVHTPGNWSKAEYGGENRKLCVAPAGYLKAALLKLDELAGSLGSNKPAQSASPPPTQIGKDTGSDIDNLSRPPPQASLDRVFGFEVIQECTHHGPYLETPCMFIEIGSSENEWSNKEAGKVIAETIIHLLRNPPANCKTIFGIGGLHHTPEFSKIIRRTDYAAGHVCPKYNADNLDTEMIRQALEKNFGNKGEVEVVLDWKGLKAGKENVVKLLDDVGIGFRKTKELV